MSSILARLMRPFAARETVYAVDVGARQPRYYAAACSNCDPHEIKVTARTEREARLLALRIAWRDPHSTSRPPRAVALAFPVRVLEDETRALREAHERRREDERRMDRARRYGVEPQA